MVYCTECGYKLPNGSAFCNLCGCTELDNFNYIPDYRNLKLIEKHCRCGLCKGIITGKEKYCPYCGKPYTAVITLSPINEYIKELSKIEKKRQKTQESDTKSLTADPLDIEKLALIRSFPIPVPYIYVKEFIIYASENIDVKLTKIPTDDEVFNRIMSGDADLIIKKDISDEWLIKMRAAYEQAKKIFTKNPQEIYDRDEKFEDLQSIYFAKLRELNLTKSYETEEDDE